MHRVCKIVQTLVQAECLFFAGWFILAGSMLAMTEVKFNLTLPLIGVILSLFKLMICEIVISFVQPTDPPVT